jgi:hypothetical protein
VHDSITSITPAYLRFDIDPSPYACVRFGLPLPLMRTHFMDALLPSMVSGYFTPYTIRPLHGCPGALLSTITSLIILRPNLIYLFYHTLKFEINKSMLGTFRLLDSSPPWTVCDLFISSPPSHGIIPVHHQKWSQLLIPLLT